MTGGITRMQTCPQIVSVDDDGTPATSRLAALVRRGWRAYWEYSARRATVLILHSLDRRTLHDIGIDPSEIESCVYGRSGDRLRRYADSWPWRSRM